METCGGSYNGEVVRDPPEARLGRHIGPDLTLELRHSNGMAKVLVYGDEEVSSASYSYVLRTLQFLCRSKYDVQGVKSEVLATAPWEASTRLVVVPDSHMYTSSAWSTLTGMRTAKQQVQAYVMQGGTILALGASAACIDNSSSSSGDSVATLEQNKDGQSVAHMRTLGRGQILWHCASEPAQASIQRMLEAAQISTHNTIFSALPSRTPILVASQSASLLDAWAEKLRTHAAAAAPTNATETPGTYITDSSDTWVLHNWQPTYANKDVAECVGTDADDEKVTSIVLVPEKHFAEASESTRDFDLARYFEALSEARAVSASMPWPRPRSFHTAVGHIIAYARAIKSTQTALDSNRCLLEACVPGMTFFATQQVQGRGRGQNAWISPRGCLQFSTLVSLPLHIGSKSVLLQYLAALAVVYGVSILYPSVRGRVRIKWPNDLYAQVPEEQLGSICITEHGMRKHFVKIGGILVTAVCTPEAFHAIVGCGINCLNNEPTTSVHALAHDDTPVTQEACAGAIMAALESLVRVFADVGYTFAPFAEAYEQAWLHSDQDVCLADMPDEPRRIVGITSDYGLLRTVPRQAPIRASDACAWCATPVPGVVDVQPDGNSFDMLQGLVKKKI